MPRAPSSAAGCPRILISGWAGAGNVGDELLTRAMVTRLRVLGAEPVVASQDPAATRALHGVEAVPWGPRGFAARNGVDGVCVGPGGILQDTSSVWSLPGHLAMALLAQRRGVPVAAIGVGAEPLRRRSSVLLLRRALGSAGVVTRDEASTVALRAAGLEVATGVDVVFGLELPTPEPTGEIVVSIGGSVRPGRIVPAARRLDPAPIAEMAPVIDRLAQRLDARVVLTRFRGERDATAAFGLQAALHAEAVVLEPDVDEHVRRVCGARLVLSSRYHPLVLAARAGVAAVAVSAQPKVRSLVGQIDRPWVQLAGSWAEIGETMPESPGRGVVPDGLDRAHEALAALVAEARATRARRSLG